jgi:hypothetical protein
MADPLAVTPDGLRKTAKNLADVSARFKEVLTSLQAKLDAEGPKWGADRQDFATGPNGYLPQLDWVVQSTNAKTGLLDGYSQSLYSAANNLEGQDKG